MEKYLQIGASILIFIVDGLLWHRLVYSMCVFRYNKKFRYIPPAIWILVFILRSLLNEVAGGAGYAEIVRALTLSMGFVLSFIFYKDKIIKLLIWNIVHILLMAVSELCTISILWIGTRQPVELVINQSGGYYIGTVISKFLMFMIIWLITTKKERYNVVLKKGPLDIVILGVIITVVFAYSVYMVRNRDSYHGISEWFLSGTLIALFVIVTLVVRILFHLFRTVQQEMDTQHKLQKLEMERQFYDDIEKVVSSLRSLRHDLNNHFSVINGFLETGEYQQCHKYMQEVCSEMDIANSFVCVENTAVSILLNNKISKAKRKGIDIESIISFDNFTMPYKTICSLIGNILDNAIEATEKTEDKYIQLIVKGKDGECKISCENTYAEKPIFSNGNYQTSKKDSKDHGIGLSKIREIVQEYHGTIDIQIDDTFLISLTLKA
ncbi:MAG: hypothetical protein H6Q59_1515 [Firmicutes bacterium]|nr:hypothetical protein [Bacillota bacterium]